METTVSVTEIAQALKGRFTAVRKDLHREISKLSSSSPSLTANTKTTTVADLANPANAIPPSVPSELGLPLEVRYSDLARQLTSLIEMEASKQEEASPPSSLSLQLPQALGGFVSILYEIVRQRTEAKVLTEYKKQIISLLHEGRELQQGLESQKVYTPCFSNSPLSGRGDRLSLQGEVAELRVTLFAWSPDVTLYLFGEASLPNNITASVGREITLQGREGDVTGVLQIEGDRLILAGLILQSRETITYPFELGYQGPL